MNSMNRDIVHILSGLEYGGIETWLMNVLRSSPTIRQRSRIVLVGGKSTSKNSYHAEVKAMNIPIDYIRLSGNTPLRGFDFISKLSRWLRENRIEIVHSHLNYLSGLVTFAGYVANVPNRLAHYHV